MLYAGMIFKKKSIKSYIFFEQLVTFYSVKIDYVINIENNKK